METLNLIFQFMKMLILLSTSALILLTVLVKIKKIILPEWNIQSTIHHCLQKINQRLEYNEETHPRLEKTNHLGTAIICFSYCAIMFLLAIASAGLGVFQYEESIFKLILGLSLYVVLAFCTRFFYVEGRKSLAKF